MHFRWVDLAMDPVMLSTLEDGKVVKGLAGLPLEGPAVLVGYHMLLGLELGPLVTRLFHERKIHLRGIAHPFMFDRASELLMLDSSSFDGYRLLGAVPVSAANFYKLLSRKSFVLLYPGGAREALHKKVTSYHHHSHFFSKIMISNLFSNQLFSDNKNHENWISRSLIYFLFPKNNRF